jgi:hypothetical protein
MPDGGAIPAAAGMEKTHMRRKDEAQKMAVAVAQGASEKKPYVPPALEKHERLDEVVEGPVLNVSGAADL